MRSPRSSCRDRRWRQTLSLLSELRRPDGPVSAFFALRFPDTKPVRERWRETVAGSHTIRPRDRRPPWATLGTAIDYRIRYAFACTPVHELAAATGAAIAAGGITITSRLHGARVLRSAHAPALGRWSASVLERFFSELEDRVERISPVGALPSEDDERDLARYCFVLALLETCYRSAAPIDATPLGRLTPESTTGDLLELADDPWVDDLCTMSAAFHEHQAELIRLPVVCNPVFAGSRDVGGADADLIAGTCLIDIKATVRPVPLDDIWLYQLLGYVLLDYDDRFGIDETSVYLARQGLLVRWPVAELISTLSEGRAPPLDELRHELRALLARHRPA